MNWYTRLPVEECNARLRAGIDPERLAFSWSGFAGSKPILGKVRDSGFRLRKRRYYKNDLAPFFYGRFVPEGSSTRIEGEFKMHPVARVFVIVWFSFLACLFVIASIPFVKGRQDADVGTLLASIGLAAFGIVLIKFGRWLARGEGRAIVAFLESTLEVEGRTDAIR